MTLDVRLRAAFRASFGRAPDGVVRAPGRVNLIGEHTDYNGGFVLPCAIGAETRIAWAGRADASVQVVACDFGREIDRFEIDKPIPRHPLGSWRDYVRGMVETMRADGVPLAGVDLTVAGDISLGAGLSSSASLEVAVGHAMLAASGRILPAARLAVLAQTAENDFVGMKCGVMDQLASAAGVADAALLIDCRDLSTRVVPIAPDIAVAIVHSGVVRGLVEGHYNRRRVECEEAARVLRVDSLRDADAASLAAAELPDDVRARARHVVTENARVLAAAEALSAGDLVAMGRLMAESHASMRDDFLITVPKVDELAAVAHRAIGGEGGARMTGGGFGGAIVALLRSDRVDAFAQAVHARYRTPAGEVPTITIERAAAGAGPTA